MQKFTTDFESRYRDEIQSLINGDNYHPHQILGLHDFFEREKVIRLWRPDAKELYIEVAGKIVKTRQLHKAGFFEYVVPLDFAAKDYRVYHHDGSLAHDPYAFLPTIGEMDQYLFGKGTHYELYRAMGARCIQHEGTQGVAFTAWAPNAKRVSVVGDFNSWDGRVNPMRSLGHSGIWELFVPDLAEGSRYKFEVKSQDDTIQLKADPFARYSEVRPGNASVVKNVENYTWNDQKWVEQRSLSANDPKPLNIYEVHLGSWKKNGDGFLSYKKLAHELVDYCKETGFNAIELMPVMEHPLDESWGYQVTGYYAVTSRFGEPEDFQYFIDYCHQHEISVILDWVPGHFPTDEHSLGRFDGTALYEHEDPKQGFHPHWSTLIFNFERNEVSNFILANALYWIEVMHVDGLRVDAVASMLYLDYGREKGEWIPNKYGGNENLAVIEFFKHLNSVVPQRNPGTMLIAEESTSFTGISHPLDQGGLGFDMKWNMGWMHDTLQYFSRDHIFRHYHHNELTFGILYAFSERFLLPLSHDEVVHGKKSLLSKMPGDEWQQFANLRLLLSYQMCQPGKKLLFMGGEIGQWNEWSSTKSIEWDLLKYSTHHGIQTMVKELNHIYLEHAPFWERDFDYKGFEWIDFQDRQNSIICYYRKAEHSKVICIHNFTSTYHENYQLPLIGVQSVKQLFNSDETAYGGSGKSDSNPTIDIDGNLTLSVAPLATQIYLTE